MDGRYTHHSTGTAAALAPLVARAARRDHATGAAIRAALRLARPLDWNLAALAIVADPPRPRHNDNRQEHHDNG